MKKILLKKLYILQIISSNFISFSIFLQFSHFISSMSNFNFIYIFHFSKGCCFNGLDKWRLDDKSLVVELVDTSWYF